MNHNVTAWSSIAALLVLLTGCYQSFGLPPDAECRSDTECPRGTFCTSAGICICSPSHCEGCCTADGTRCGGQEPTACGRPGEVCRDCTVSGGRCEGWTCVDGPTCTDECDIVGRSCLDDTSWIECRDADGDGCLERSEDVACPDPQVCDAGSCVDRCGPGNPCPTGSDCIAGVCVGACEEECAEEGTFCIDDRSWYQCTQLDSDECLERSLDTECDDGQRCLDGSCGTACTEVCDPESPRTCRGSSVVACVTDDVGCTSRTVVDECEDSETCVDGECRPATCALDCAEVDPYCFGPSTLVECVEPEEEGCPTWERNSCDASLPFCEEGECRYDLELEVSGMSSLFRVIGVDGALCYHQSFTHTYADATMGDVDADGSLEVVVIANANEAAGTSDNEVRLFTTECSPEDWSVSEISETLHVLLLTDLTGDGVVDIVIGEGNPGDHDGAIIDSFAWDGVAVSPGPIWARTTGGGIRFLEVVPPDIIRGATNDDGTGTELCVHFDGAPAICP